MNNNRRQIGITLHEKDYHSAKLLAEKRRTSLASILREALAWYVADNFEMIHDSELLNSSQF
jgi:hypothetical protein